MNVDTKISNEISANRIQQYVKGLKNPTMQMELLPGMQSLLNI